LKGIWWYDFQDDGWRAQYNEHNFGMVRPDLTPKPSFHAFRAVATIAAEAEFLGRTETGNPDVWILKFRKPDRTVTWAMWTESDDCPVQVTLSCPEASDMLSVEVTGSPSISLPWGYRGWAESKPEVHTDRFSLVLTERPVLLTGRLEQAKVLEVVARAKPLQK
jgi:hypothetical protein